MPLLLAGAIVSSVMQPSRCRIAKQCGLVGEDADYLGAALGLAIEPFDRIGRKKLGTLLDRKAHDARYSGYVLVHQPGIFGVAGCGRSATLP